LVTILEEAREHYYPHAYLDMKLSSEICCYITVTGLYWNVSST